MKAWLNSREAAAIVHRTSELFDATKRVKRNHNHTRVSQKANNSRLHCLQIKVRSEAFSE
jgi:hypothetical protein